MRDHRYRSITTPSHQNGVSLIDAMIAVVIFSVGLLAVAALQTISKQSNYEAIQRTYAASLAYDLFERMRMNASSAFTLSYYATSTSTVLTGQTYTPCTINCSQQQMAQNDLYEWTNNLIGNSEQSSGALVGGLVDPVACLRGPATGNSGRYILTIAWRGQSKLENKNTTNECGLDTINEDFRRLLELDTYIY